MSTLHQYHTVLITVLKSGSVSPSVLFFSFNIVWLFSIFCLPIWTLESFYIHKITCRDFDWDCIEPISNLGRSDILTIVSLSIHEYGLFLHFSVLWFLALAFCDFPHRDPIPILLAFLFVRISLWSAHLNSILLLISNSTCLLLVYRKIIDFYILNLHPANLL